MAAIIQGEIKIEGIYKGDEINLDFEITGINLTGKTLLCQVRKDANSPLALEFNEADNSLTKTVVSTSVTNMTLSRSSIYTSKMSEGVYKLSVVSFTNNTDVQTIIVGTLEIINNVTVKQ